MKHPLTIVIIIFAVLLSFAIVFSAGVFFVLSLAALSFLVLKNKLKPQDRRLILILFVLSLVFRFICSTAYYLSGYQLHKGVDFMGDARAYSNNALYITYVLQGRNTDNFIDTDNSRTNSLRDCFNELNKKYHGLFPPFSYRVDGFVYFIGLLYSMFTYSPLSLKLLNGLAFTIAAVILYLIINDLFGRRAAKYSLILILFWPSTFFWSIAGLKEAATFFMIVICAWSLSDFFRRPRIINFIVFVVFLYFLSTVRVHLAISFVVGLCITFFARLKNSGKIAFLICIFIALGVAYLKFSANIAELSSSGSKFFMENTVITNRGIVNTEATTVYTIYPQRCYSGSYCYNLEPLEWLAAIVKGGVFFLLSPFPFMTSSAALMIIYPQMIIWYILFIFSLKGMLIALRYKFRDILPLITPIIFMTMMFSLIEGNMGTALRHRDILMPFYLFFSVVGILNFFGKLNVPSD